MAVLTPQLTGTPGVPLTYNPSIAETFSWIPVDNNVSRPLFAKAVYSINRSTLHGQNGFNFIGTGETSIEEYNSLHVIQNGTYIDGLTADNCYLGNGTTISTHLTATPLPSNFILTGRIRGVTIKTGSVIAYK